MCAELLQERPNVRQVVYVGDGSNDVCPVLRYVPHSGCRWGAAAVAVVSCCLLSIFLLGTGVGVSGGWAPPAMVP